jgi:hypothetical protein
MITTSLVVFRHKHGAARPPRPRWVRWIHTVARHSWAPPSETLVGQHLDV